MIIYKVSRTPDPGGNPASGPSKPPAQLHVIVERRWGNKMADLWVWQDIISGDEIISDSYDLKEVDGTVYEVDCAMITLGAVEVSK